MSIIHETKKMKEKKKKKKEWMNKQMPCRKYTEIVWISSCKHCQLRFNTLIYAFYYEITLGAWNFSGQLLNECVALRIS